MAGTSPAMTAPAHSELQPRRLRVAFLIAKKQKPCYAFLFAGLAPRRPEAFPSKMGKIDAIHLLT
jgi:hypothetical protein